jgi:RimJ/RimL family protein N-acetyltransferase
MKEILLDFPDSFETERLIIRCPGPGDGKAINEAIIESLEDLKPWMPWAQKAPALEESEALCRQWQAKWLTREDLVLHLYRKEDGKFVGGSGLHRINWTIPKFEIGYWCRVSMQGKGYITEAVEGLTNFAFETLKARRVEIRCDEKNMRSRHVADRLGFPLEARLVNEGLNTRGELRNTLIYAKTR